MRTYNQIPFNKIASTLTLVAQGVSCVTGSDFPVSDIIHSLGDFQEKSWEGLKEPYYIAIRETGAENGYKDYCLFRCKTLGYPLVIAKIEEDKVCDYNMTITFTHGWMDRDINYMEQEFNSL